MQKTNGITSIRAVLPAAFIVFLMLGSSIGAPPAYALSLVPIAQDFEPAGRGSTRTFRLENETNEQVAVAIKLTTREVSIDGQETNRDTRDFLVFPRNALIGPRQSQVIRVQWQGAPNPARELAYRIIAEQLPIKRSLEPNARAIQIVVRYVGSIYVISRDMKPDVAVESARAVTDPQNRRLLELVLQNKGRAHTLLDEPELAVTAGGETRTLKGDDLKEVAGENVLAESRRRFLVPWPGNLPFEQPRVEFKYMPLR